MKQQMLLLNLTKTLISTVWSNKKPYCNSKRFEGKTVQEPLKTVDLKPLKPMGIETLNMFLEMKTDGNENTRNSIENDEILFDYKQYKLKIKQVNSNDLRAKILYYYLKSKTKNGIFKKESNKIIGNYFGCKQDLIRDTFNYLKKLEYIDHVNDIDIHEVKSYYKILKGWED